MERIITDEFIRYKAGFISGKWDIIEAYKLGKIINPKEILEESNNSSWYNRGYEDGFNIYATMIDNGSLDLTLNNDNELINEGFLNRTTIVNKEEGSEVPFVKFKL